MLLSPIYRIVVSTKMITVEKEKLKNRKIADLLFFLQCYRCKKKLLQRWINLKLISSTITYKLPPIMLLIQSCPAKIISKCTISLWILVPAIGTKWVAPHRWKIHSVLSITPLRIIAVYNHRLKMLFFLMFSTVFIMQNFRSGPIQPFALTQFSLKFCVKNSRFPKLLMVLK